MYNPTYSRCSKSGSVIFHVSTYLSLHVLVLSATMYMRALTYLDHFTWDSPNSLLFLRWSASVLYLCLRPQSLYRPQHTHNAPLFLLSLSLYTIRLSPLLIPFLNKHSVLFINILSSLYSFSFDCSICFLISVALQHI